MRRRKWASESKTASKKKPRRNWGGKGAYGVGGTSDDDTDDGEDVSGVRLGRGGGEGRWWAVRGDTSGCSNAIAFYNSESKLLYPLLVHRYLPDEGLSYSVGVRAALR